MRLSSDQRAVTALLLYFSLQVALFACQLHHGQMAGLQLNGPGSAFCGSYAQAAPAVDLPGAEGDALLALFCATACSLLPGVLLPLLLLALWLPAVRILRSYSTPPPLPALQRHWHLIHPRAP